MTFFNIAILSLAVTVLLIGLGIIVHSLASPRPDGVIHINTSDPMKDTYTLELYISFGELDKKERVYFEVSKE